MAVRLAHDKKILFTQIHEMSPKKNITKTDKKILISVMQLWNSVGTEKQDTTQHNREKQSRKKAKKKNAVKIVNSENSDTAKSASRKLSTMQNGQ